MRILIADDDEVERTAMKDILQAFPAVEVFEAADGQEALDKLCDGLKPQLCIFDIRMPKLDGKELLQRMRRDPLLRDVKVIIASSNRDRDTIIALAHLSIVGYLLKPYEKAKVVALVDQHVKAAHPHGTVPPIPPQAGATAP